VPTQLTYPGVYVEELPSGVRTIVGVSTSITAFVGRARRGPVETPVDVFSFDGFTRVFGGLWAGSTLAYAVRDFFLNGGGHAVIVRLNNGAKTAALTVGGVNLEAADPGSWGADLRAEITLAPVDPALATQLNTTLFNLVVREDRDGGAVERFQNLSVDDNLRNITEVLKRESTLVRCPSPGTVPTLAGGADHVADPISDLEEALAAAKEMAGSGLPDPGKIKAAQDALSAAVTEARAAVDDGDPLSAAAFIASTLGANQGLRALDQADTINLLCIPPHAHQGGDLEQALVAAAVAYCQQRRAMMIVDPHEAWKDPGKGLAWLNQLGTPSPNAAVFFPRLRQPDSERGGSVGEFAPCGAVAGVFARTDAARGVWKAPAGLAATLAGVPDLSVKLTDAENGSLNPLGINCLRSFPVVGRVVWGSRTLVGADVLASEWKYVPVRRLALFIEESLFRGTQWVVFEPNDEPLWAQIRLNVGAFMQDLFRQGAFAGVTPREAFAVRCDRETTTPLDQQRGIVNIVVQFAPLRPAEFVVIRLQQLAGQTGN
jgi:uncharacterized protein